MLPKSSTFYHAIFQETPHPLFIFNADGTIFDANPAALRLTNTSKDRLLKKPATRFFAFRNLPARLTSLLRGEESEIIIRRVLLKSTQVFAWGRLAPLPSAQGKPSKILFTAHLLKELTLPRSHFPPGTEHIPLTEKEKLGLYGLVQYAGETDDFVAKKIGLPRPTVTAIKNRLRKEGYYRTLNIPRFDALGCELYSPAFTKLGFLAPPFDVRGKTGTKEYMMKAPEAVFLEITDKEGFAIYASQSLTEYKKTDDFVKSTYRGLGMDLEDIYSFHFPQETSCVCQYFSMGSLLYHQFDLDIEKDHMHAPAPPLRMLTRKEKQVLYALTLHPELNDTQLGKKINTPHATISKMKRKFIESGLLNVVRWPNFEKLGLKLLTLTHIRYPRVSIPEHVKKEITNPTMFFSLFGETDAVFINLFQNYTEMKNTLDAVCQEYKKEYDMESNPERYVLPLDNVKFSKIDFAPLTKKVLGL